jgi:predicted phage-related endonuclease
MPDIRYTFPKPTHGSQEWLNVRWKDEDGLSRISASVAAALHGQHPYTSMADLAVELLSPEPPTPSETNAAMDRGNRLEPVLVQWFADLEKIEVKTPEEMYAFESEDGKLRLIATLDGITPDGIPVEIKTSNKMWMGSLPPMWHWQGVHQAICVGSNKVEWGIFDSNLELHRYTQWVSSDEIQNHMQACRVFLDAIDRGELPEDAILEYKHAEHMYPTSTTVTVELDPVVVGKLLDDLDAARAVKKQAEIDENHAKTALALLLEEADTGTINGEPCITWRTIKRHSLDTKALEAQHPALVEKFQKTTAYRMMKTNNKRSK